jgi:hypothetical protein
MMEETRAQLIHLETDRRLGHEWDEWDGTPLPQGGNFDSPVSFFFLWSFGSAGLAMGVVWAGLLLLRPQLAALHPALPGLSLLVLGALAVVVWVWWALLLFSWVLQRPLLPERLAERGPFLRLMQWTSRVARRFGWRDRVENSAVKVFNGLALLRKRKVGRGELLLLVPRCLSRETLEGVLAVAGRHAVPVFVATRGQLARRVIRERRPRAVVAVACERDMVTGLRDVAGKVPVLGITLRLPGGPCKDTVIDLKQLEAWVQAYVA